MIPRLGQRQEISIARLGKNDKQEGCLCDGAYEWGEGIPYHYPTEVFQSWGIVERIF